MIREIHIENFRSINRADLPLGKITVLTGANNSGKSSILYGLMVLQDFVMNPNQTLEELFALPFINLGGFEEVKSKYDFEKEVSEFIRLGITASSDRWEDDYTSYMLTLGKGKTALDLSSKKNRFDFKTNLNIGLPYTGLNETTIQISTEENKDQYLAKWNGFQSEMLNIGQFSDLGFQLKGILDAPVSSLITTDFVPVSRGFTKPYYNIVPMTGIVNTEEQIATMLKTENRADTLGALNLYLEDLTGRKVEVASNGTPGLFSLKTVNQNTGKSNFLVNEGSGTNQLVTILAKIFQYNSRFTCIDEPEIHLHPSMVRALAHAFIQINMEFDHQFLVSTHSEHFVQALLESVATGAVDPQDVVVYHLDNKNGQTTIERQEINSKGQISGGLAHFYAQELSGLKSIFKIVD
jgi:predicted ATPase